ncbi:hypothetical protein FNB15_05455 [Ferrovibrio terrae]|uniref:Uncharacterized protein n=1 Tax=Ferrovibrio terrae TaxID=2594003 RepID=A0A516GYZ6_9PROT|nr:hypothetical protein [Ferrovibrio terrae]QDO96758.1 hypothetical protein FNB15_05455 [Ferrovibrio terrae]
MIDTIQTTQVHANSADDDFLLDDGLPCLRRDGKLYYLSDVQPRVLEACRHFEISFDQLSEKLGMNRPAMVLILKGYDPVPLPLKSMIDRLLGQVGLLPPQPADISAAANDVAPTPIVTTIHAVPVPDPVAEEAVITVMAEEVGETLIPQPLTPGRPAASVSPRSVPMVPPVVFAAGLPEFTPGLRRAPRRRRSQLGA